MAPLRCESPIDLLPEELLCMIFDLLELENVKDASCTCRRWHDIIFFSDYIKRFQFKLAVPFLTDKKPVCQKTLQYIEQHIDAVKHTQRCYRNMNLTIKRTDADVQSFWNILHPKITKNIRTLKLTFWSYCTKSAVEAILKEVNEMPALRSFVVHAYHLPLSFLTIKSATVDHLEMDSWCHFSFDIPQLRTFVGPLRALTQPDQPLVFTYLKRLVLTDCAVQLKGRCKLNRLTQVETLELAIHDIEDWLLPAIHDKYTALRHLYFCTFLRNVDIAILRQLSKFTLLRHLTFRAIQMKDRFPLDIDFGLSELTELELLDLGSDVLLDRNLMRLPKSIKYLTLQITSTNEEVVIETISRNLTGLQKLHLIYQCNPYVEVPKQTMKSICLLKQLEVLVFEFAKFTESVFLDVEAPMYQMRELLFAFCESDRDLVLEWRQIFPNLKTIQFPLSSPMFCFRKEIQLDSL
ncbi:uncharacterized protein LOC125957281 [Anopheles darlingi]|uniref:uncharacterized protein LOC125957281 n=1 Tax=Anopheles darlingi TaxID=43151 RepID=UPI00210050C3|nr:uncharacterized protein LOC125957281 [Anopheles darlingi]